jgi:hypothetical protein
MSDNNRYTLFQINLSSFITLLTVLFIGLKLGNVISWSWWWVFAPVWAPFAALAFAWFVVWFLGWLLFRNSRKNYKFPW